jgi:hypothetical protein
MAVALGARAATCDIVQLDLCRVWAGRPNNNEVNQTISKDLLRCAFC